MKKISKILSIILTLIMVISIIPMSTITSNAVTLSGTCGDNVTWSYDTSTYTLTISGTGAMYDFEYNNRPWGDFKGVIKKVVINNGVTKIGDSAFNDCGSLTCITIPDSVTTIGNFAFYYCASLTGIIIPDNVTTIGDSAFSNCFGLTSITIPDGVTKISDHMFFVCTSLTSVTIPDSVTTIGDSAFYNCDSLTSVTIPDGVIVIGDYAFYDCGSLTSVIIPNSITTIGDFAFYVCNSLNVVYYLGITSQWNEILIGKYNDNLTDTIIRFLGENAGGCTYIPVVTQPTCTEQGYTTCICTNCGDKYKVDYTNALDHKYENVVVKNATCTEKGRKEQQCTRCGDVGNSWVIQPKGHTYSEVVTSPTCTKDGYTTYTCDCGDTYMKNMIPAIGHEDNDVDAHCDYCDELLCNHDCHKGGITGFFWKISNFFNRLFGSNKYCECGVAHY